VPPALMSRWMALSGRCGILPVKLPPAAIKTFSLCSRQLRCEAPQELGSQARREQRVSAARQLYAERWGAPGSYLLPCSDSLPGESIDSFRETLLAAARHGDRITVTAAAKQGRLLLQEGLSALHENITMLALRAFSLAESCAGLLRG